MSASFRFRDGDYPGSNGSIQLYLEAIGAAAAAQHGADDPLAAFCRWRHEAWFTGQVIVLDEVLTDPAACARFVAAFDAATERLIRDDEFSESGRAWIAAALGPLRARVAAAAAGG